MTRLTATLCLLFSFLFATSQTIDFTFTTSNGLFCNPSTIQFTQNATGNPTSFLWNLGNGLKSTAANPSTSYIYPGTYTVKLTAIYPDGAREISKTFKINPEVVPVISADRNYLCQPGVTNFTGTSNGTITNYDWDFGDASGVVSGPSNTSSHNFLALGEYSVVLTATTESGCIGTDTMVVEVKQLPIEAKVSGDSGCIPHIATFTASTIIPSNDAVTSYSWNFDDGSTPTLSTDSSTSHTYTRIGSFDPELTVTTREGCINTFSFRTAYGIRPTNTTAYTPKPIVCGSETPLFVAKATNANEYLWDFGDDSLLIATDTLTQHQYARTGTKTATVTPYYNGCPGPKDSFNISVIGTIARFVFSNTCSDKKTFSFTEYSDLELRTLLWDFGDGSPTETTMSNLVHTYPDTGAFVTTLIARDLATGCADTATRTVYTANPRLVNIDSAICKNSTTTFTMEENYSNPAIIHRWDVVGRNRNTGSTPSLSISANILGNFDNYVVISNGTFSEYCYDTIRLDHKMLVRGPYLDFTVPENTCFTEAVKIENASRPFVAADSMSFWYWNYGTSLENDTLYQPDPIEYNSPRTYNVKLTGVDINGCRDSLLQRVIVNPVPFLEVIPDTATFCLGQRDSLFAFSSDSILWSPANGLSCATCDTVLANPTSTTQYFVTATNAFNCSIQDSVLLTVIPPFTVVAGPDQSMCLNEQVTLDVDPKDKRVSWSPSESLSNPTTYNPVARPDQTTTYTATLTDSIGCFTRTADVTVFVNSLPTVEAGDNLILPFNSNFSITPAYSSNVQSYLWSPSSGLSCTTCAIPRGIALTSETYYITVTSDRGCVATDSVRIAIECKNSNILMPKAFTPNNDGLNDFYYPIARGIKTVLRFSVYNREGQILYESKNFTPNDRSFGWNGEYKGSRQSPKAYIYVMEALCESGEKLVKSDSFILLR